MMDDLNAYSIEERAHIVRLGIFLHEQGREFWAQHQHHRHESPASLADEFVATKLKEEVNAL